MKVVEKQLEIYLFFVSFLISTKNWFSYKFAKSHIGDSFKHQEVTYNRICFRHFFESCHDLDLTPERSLAQKIDFSKEPKFRDWNEIAANTGTSGILSSRKLVIVLNQN